MATGFHYKYHKQIYLGFSLYKLNWKFRPEIDFFHSKFSFYKDSTYHGKPIQEVDYFVSIRLSGQIKIKQSIFSIFYGVSAGYYYYNELVQGIPLFVEDKSTAFSFHPMLGGRICFLKKASFFVNIQSGIWFQTRKSILYLNGIPYLSDISHSVNFYSPNPINFGLSFNLN
jgi:hypothetical protein